MDELTFTKPDRAEQEKTKAIKPDLQLTSEPDVKKALKQESNKAINEESSDPSKEKATFNLSKQILQNLEEKWVRLRRELGSKKISKTMIVEAALGIVLREYENRKQESQLYSVIADHKEINTGYNK